MAAIFNDEKLVLKWGDSVPPISASSKRRSLPDENVLGDRVGLRVMTSFNGGVYDMMAEFTTAHDARRVIVPCFQANGLDGSVDIPDSSNFLRDLRKKTIPRLEFIKYHALKNAHILSKSLEKEARLKKKSASYRRSPSCDDAETSTK
ncbi:MAG: hypothetical protein EXX96DRAFT_646025 [Benjaminiella poitrasii]|nr:MAG: hypothetical protein EXX96DRAFT_646025 [Benjaminiella poitrasii]